MNPYKLMLYLSVNVVRILSGKLIGIAPTTHSIKFNTELLVWSLPGDKFLNYPSSCQKYIQ